MILDSSFSFITLALLISTSLAIPKPLPQAASPAAGDGPQSGGTQQLAGAAQQRQNLLNPPVSGNLQDFAIATLENSDGNRGQSTVQSDYGARKSGDSTNCGPFRNNIGAITAACGSLNSTATSDACSAVNTDIAAAVQCQHAQIAQFGPQGFYQWQRCGHTCTPSNNKCGDNDPDYTCDQEGQFYETAVNYMLNVIQQHTGPDDDTVGNYFLHQV